MGKRGTSHNLFYLKSLNKYYIGTDYFRDVNWVLSVSVIKNVMNFNHTYL